MLPPSEGPAGTDLAVLRASGRGEDWLSFHIFYHSGDRDLLLRDLVCPLTRGLLQARDADSFFFLRHVEGGGPHLRLRLQPAHGRTAAVRAAVLRLTGAYLAAHPSPAAVPAESIRRSGNRLPDEEASRDTFPDNSVQEITFTPEVHRYGGARLLPWSLCFFALSSVRALQLLAGNQGVPRSRWLAIAVQLLVDYGLGFARHAGELSSILGGPLYATGQGPDLLRTRGDKAFAAGREGLVRLVRQRIDALLQGELPDLADSEVARSLDRAIAEAPPPVRTQILMSQLHMAANRMGINNAEELYLARILERALTTVEQTAPDTWSRLADRLAMRADARGLPDGAIASLPGRALAAFAGR